MSPPAATTNTDAAKNPRMLLRIPSELRYGIYDFLFQRVLQKPKHVDNYMLPHEWPHPIIQTKACHSYLSVVLTSKTMHAEASTYFENFCLSQIIFHFDNVPDLSDFAKAIQRSHRRYAEMHFSLRSRCCAAELPNVAHRLRQGDIWSLMRQQPGFEDRQDNILHMGRVLEGEPGPGRATCKAGDQYQLSTRGNVRVQRIHLNKPKNVQITVTQIPRATFLPTYAEMRGAFSRLLWDGYNIDCSLERRLQYIEERGDEQFMDNDRYEYGMTRLVGLFAFEQNTMQE